MPTIEEIFLSVPLYDTITDKGLELIADVISFAEKFDGPCIGCGKETTYRSLGTPMPRYEAINAVWPYKIFMITVCCSRDEKHVVEIFLKVMTNDSFVKIGQYPSIASLSKGEIDKYRKILGDNFTEFNRGIGLVSHGVGIGSFVYLRRVFENLIEEAHREAQISENWDEGKYVQSRMDDKISLLRNQLPPFLVDHRVLYGVLSKGIHELTEQECLEIFPVVKVGIEFILDEKIGIKEKEEKAKAFKKSLEKIANELKSK